MSCKGMKVTKLSPQGCFELHGCHGGDGKVQW
jgi:hypothetical protein